MQNDVPPRPNQRATPPPPPGGPRASVVRAPSSEPSIASPVPVVAGAVATVASLALAFIALGLSTPTIVVPGLPALPLVGESWWGLSLLGYALTPTIVILALGLDRTRQRRGLADPNFAPVPRYGHILKILMIAGFVIGIWHLINISVPLSEIVSGWLP